MPSTPPSSQSPEQERASRRAAERREARARAVRRRRLTVLGLMLLALVAATLGVITALGGGPHRTRAGRAPQSTFAVGLRELHLVDSSRTITLPDGTTEPRALLAYVRYPAVGAPSATDVPDAAAARGPFPLVVFGHGFARTPALYRSLLQAWARAGYVVAAPAFPLESPGAPGGPNESDLVNQPADMSFVITSLLAASALPNGPLHGLINPSEIAVSGHSDGGDTALAVAYDPAHRDARVRAAVILSGAEIPAAEFTFPASGPALLATQGTADTINLPSATYAYFPLAPRPKYLLRLEGASHIPPYTHQQPQLGIVERTTIAFMDAYLKHMAGARRRLTAAGNVPGKASLQAEP